MGRDDPFKLPEGIEPVALGTGLVALDYVLVGRDDKRGTFWAGGSCGNVMAILAYLGWDSRPIARLDQTEYASMLRRDLSNAGVWTGFLKGTRDGSTPIILHEIHERTTGPTHTFRTRCPDCGRWLPPFKALTKTAVPRITRAVKTANVFYFDRATPAAIDLARHYAAGGALVFFEPNGIRDEKLFLRAVRVAHVLKYSEERLGEDQDLLEDVRPPLHIETLAERGVQYRIGRGAWNHLAAVKAPLVLDTAGAGDWLTAGFLHRIGPGGKTGLDKSTPSDVEAALTFGQALAALNCAYVGARGAMNHLDRATLEETVRSIIARQPGASLPQGTAAQPATQRRWARVCGSCQDDVVKRAMACKKETVHPAGVPRRR